MDGVLGGFTMIEMMLSGGSMFTSSRFTRRVNPESGVIDPPYGARAMRVAVIGAGGGAAMRRTGSIDRAMAGAGGGCAATIIVPATAISYTIGAGGPGIRYNSTSGTDPAGTGGDTIATFLDYELIGKGGPGGFVNNSTDYSQLGGIGIGGDYSFQGGAAYRAFTSVGYCASTGGGGAGPNGNGADGERNNLNGTIETANQGSFTNTGWGDGGGASGVVQNSSEGGGRRGGGAGMGQFVGDEAALSTSVFGRSDGSMGGGGSAHSGALADRSWSNGGHGGLIVEWFF